MGLFDCRGCKAKDGEILHLLAQLDKLNEMVERAQKRVTELAEPGITTRLLGPSSGGRGELRRAVVRAKMVSGFPGYEPEPVSRIEVDEGGGS